MTKLLSLRFAGPVVLGLVGALLIALGIQSYRLGSANDTVSSQRLTISGQQLAIDLAKSQLAQRDALIAKQNAAVDALVAEATKNREAYLKQFAAADQRAKSNDARARQLLNLTTTATDELARCQAAARLLAEELTQ